jgi:hypothetical protein
VFFATKGISRFGESHNSRIVFDSLDDTCAKKIRSRTNSNLIRLLQGPNVKLILLFLGFLTGTDEHLAGFDPGRYIE